jgi:hypothetical protein
MSINPVSGGGLSVGVKSTSAVRPVKIAQGKPSVAKAPQSQLKGDIVNLSAEAQAKSLQQQGELPTRITSSASANMNAVDGDSGVTGSTVVAKVLPTASPATVSSGRIDIMA